MTGNGEAADEVVRMALSGAEMTLRLTASATKNLLALSIALAKSHKKLCGKTSMKKMLRETRDIRVFSMTGAQYRQFEKQARKFGLLYAMIRDKGRDGKQVDLVLPLRSWAGPIWSLKKSAMARSMRLRRNSRSGVRSLTKKTHPGRSASREIQGPKRFPKNRTDLPGGRVSEPLWNPAWRPTRHNPRRNVFRPDSAARCSKRKWSTRSRFSADGRWQYT